MDLLKKEIERKRKELEDAKLLVNIFGNLSYLSLKLKKIKLNVTEFFKTNQKKYFKRSDLEQKQADQYLQKQKEAEKQRTETDSDHEKNITYQAVNFKKIFKFN